MFVGFFAGDRERIEPGVASAQFIRPRLQFRPIEGGAVAAYLKQHGIAGRWRDDVIRDVVEHEAMQLPDGKFDMKWAPDSMNWEERRGDYHDLKPIFRSLSLPMLYIMSEQRVSIFRDLPALAAELPNFHLTTIRRTGHNMYMERPDAVSSLITTFVDNKTVPEMI